MGLGMTMCKEVPSPIPLSHPKKVGGDSLLGDCRVEGFHILTSTPLPKIPPKYQTSSVRWSLFFSTVPPGKNKRMLAKKPHTARGMRDHPRHLAQEPVHMLGQAS